MANTYTAVHVLGLCARICTDRLTHVSAPATFPESDQACNQHRYLGEATPTLYIRRCHLAPQHFVLYSQ